MSYFISPKNFIEPKNFIAGIDLQPMSVLGVVPKLNKTIDPLPYWYEFVRINSVLGVIPLARTKNIKE